MTRIPAIIAPGRRPPSRRPHRAVGDIHFFGRARQARMAAGGIAAEIHQLPGRADADLPTGPARWKAARHASLMDIISSLIVLVGVALVQRAPKG